MDIGLPLLRDLTEKDLKDRRVLVRLDLNVPIKNGILLDDYRIRRSFSTIRYLQDRGARIIIVSHNSNSKQSLEPVAGCLQNCVPVVFAKNLLDEDHIKQLQKEHAHSVILLENLRFYKEEEENNLDFGKRLASYADLYVNDAFSVSHRPHTSIVLLPKLLPSYAGLLFENEVSKLSTAFNPPHPFLFILGGGKVQSKFFLIKKFLNSADVLYVGGAVANNFFKEMGYEVGLSHYEEVKEDVRALLQSKKIVLTADVRVKIGDGISIKKPEDVSREDTILDAGPLTLASLKGHIEKAEFILWNGPIGDYLIEGFSEGTERLIAMLAWAKARVIVGGGDTATMISRMGMLDAFDFVSTGGGAMVQFLAEETLPGIEALRRSH